MAEIKLKGIIAKIDDVNSILDGRQSILFKNIKPPKNLSTVNEVNISNSKERSITFKGKNKFNVNGYFFKNIHITEGDVIYLREMYTIQNGEIIYRSSTKGEQLRKDKNTIWAPGVYMRNEYARIFLKITELKIVRIDEVSNQDAINSGIKIFDNPVVNDRIYLNYMRINQSKSSIRDFSDPKKSFRSKIIKNNGLHQCTLNPYFFQIHFERIKKPLNFIRPKIQYADE